VARLGDDNGVFEGETWNGEDCPEIDIVVGRGGRSALDGGEVKNADVSDGGRIFD
jgi:hypothetical protein